MSADRLVQMKGVLCGREAVLAVVQRHGPAVQSAERLPDGDWRITLAPDADPQLAVAVRSEILDQQVRLDIEQRTRSLREAIYQRAFAPAEERPRRFWFRGR